MGVTVRDVDAGYAALVAAVYGLAKRKPRIQVGILEKDGSREYPGGATVLQVAEWNEFGTDTIPARSFIRAWFDENESALRQDLTRLMQSVIRGERSPDQVLELLGLRCVGQIQQRMADGIEPPNAPSTVARKGSSTPLINLEILRSSVSYRVEG